MIYYNVYNEVLNEVALFAEQHGIGLVLRFNSEPIDANDRASVLEGVNRHIVFQKNSNITPNIIDRLNRRAAQRATGVQTK